MNTITGRELYNLYHNEGTRKQAIEIALQQAEPLIQRRIYGNTQMACDNDDMAQECRMAVLANLDKYDPDRGAFSTFIDAYIFNAAWAQGYKSVYGVSAYKQKRYNIDTTVDIQVKDQTGQAIEDCMAYMDSGYNVEEDVLENIEREINAKRLYAALALLPEKQRQALIAVYGLYGRNPMSTREYATLINVAQNTVNDWCSRGMKTLRAIYGAEEQPRIINRTGEKGRDRKGRPFVIVRYGGCKDIDAVIKDHSTYYMVFTVKYETLINRDLLYKKCTVKPEMIDPDTVVYGKRAAAYF